jgi:hypothetical protein
MHKQQSTHDFKLRYDVAHCCTIGELFDFMERWNAKIDSFEARGPAGGNPLIAFSFTNRQDLQNFKTAITNLV